jgi:hypothetical protein
VVEMEAGPTATRCTRSRTRTATPVNEARELLEAARGLRDHPLRLRHAVHPGAHAWRARAELLRLDSTYASSLAIMRRILRLEGVLD